MSSTISAAMCSTSALSESSMRGVKPRATMRRSRAWRGSSMAIIELKYSADSGRVSAMPTPWPEQKSSARRLISTMSA